jgi:hypothetical protein
VDLIVVHRAEVRMQYDAVVEEREAADAVEVRIHGRARTGTATTCAATA